MKYFSSTFLVWGVFLILGTIQVVSQDRNSISGFVFDESRAPVSQVNVELQDEYYSIVSRVRTRGSGMFSFGGLPPGRYNVKVVTGGTDFEEQTKSVSLVPLVRGGTTVEQVDFYLTRRKNRISGTLTSPGVVYAQEVPAEASNLYNAALMDLESKDEKAAFEKLKRSIEIFPDYFLALDKLGNEYVLRGYYEPAFILLTKATTINKRSYTSMLGLGLAAFRLGQFDKSIESFKSAVELEKSFPNGHLWLGIALHAKKKYPEALTSLLKADSLSGGNVAEVHWQLARVYKDQNQFAKSADELEHFLRLSPEAKNAAEIRNIIAALRNKK